MTNEIKEILYLEKYIDEYKSDEKSIINGNRLTTPAMLDYLEVKSLLDYITNLQEENRILKELNVCVGCNNPDYKSRCELAIEYITSYEAISTIQGLDKIEQNKKLDERTMNVMVERYLKVHHNLLNILGDKDE